MTISTLDELFERIKTEERETVPPYPQDFKIPKDIRDRWAYVNIGKFGEKNIVRLLKMNEQILLPEIGDMFNIRVMPRTVNKGKKTPHKIFELRRFQTNTVGYIIEGESQYGYETLKKGQDLRKDIVVRVEVIEVKQEYKHVEFYCVALAHTFDRSNIKYNLVHCNYQRVR